MTEILEDIFHRTRKPTVQYKGLTVHAAYFKHVTRPGMFVLRFLHEILHPVQAFSIHLDDGKLVVEGQEAQRGIFRRDTCPELVIGYFEPPPWGTRISLFNEWIDENGNSDAWIGHAGMLVEEFGNKVFFHCSDGKGEPTFDDLIVEIEFIDDADPRYITGKA